VAPSVDSLFDLSENTWILLGGMVSRNAKKSVAASAFVRPYGAWILI
jgi:hypothetical protein